MSDSTLTHWARLLLGTLARSGVRHVIISPGSRSTPFAFAALTTEGLICHSLLDERSAGFFGLGQGRVTASPSLLICTSGSAAAQYTPAVVEAALSFTPLLILTADRPFELSGCGAPQAMDQVKLYGGFARGYFELGHPDPDPGALDGLERMAVQAFRACLDPCPGPVQINARARKPLEPRPPQSNQEIRVSEAVEARLSRPVPQTFPAEAHPAEAAIQELSRVCAETARGLIVCGPIPAWRGEDASLLGELARVTGFPLCAEATSQARFSQDFGAPRIGAMDAILGSRQAAQFAPDLVLQFGAPPTSGGLARLLSSGTRRRAVITAQGHLDPQSRANWLVSSDPFSTAGALARRLAARETPSSLKEARSGFAKLWHTADQKYFSLLGSLIEAQQEGSLDEACVVRSSVAALPSGAWLGLGNSLPIREVDALVPPGSRSLGVWSQRGVNGIDGLISGALGASVALGVASLVLLGDVSFLHDISGLAACSMVTAPLAIVVIDNGGGRIFTELPVAELLDARPDLANFWLTPPDVELSHAALLYRLPYERVTDRRALQGALGSALTRPGVTLIHAVVPSESARRLSQALSSRFDAALETELSL